MGHQVTLTPQENARTLLSCWRLSVVAYAPSHLHYNPLLSIYSEPCGALSYCFPLQHVSKSASCTTLLLLLMLGNQRQRWMDVSGLLIPCKQQCHGNCFLVETWPRAVEPARLKRRLRKLEVACSHGRSSDVGSCSVTVLEVSVCVCETRDSVSFW